MGTDDLVLEGSPDPEMVGKPCAYCGKPCEGYFSIHRDGFGEGPDVPLCIEHGGYETPTCEEIWDRISHAGKEHVKADRALVRMAGEEFPVTNVDIHLGTRTPTKQQLAKAWGCDACGVQRYQRVPDQITVKLVGGPHPGIWGLQEARLCDVCVNQRKPNTVVEAFVMAVKGGKPVKGNLLDCTRAPPVLVYAGLDQWLREHDKGTVVAKLATPNLAPKAKADIREKLARGRQVFGPPVPPGEEE